MESLLQLPVKDDKGSVNLLLIVGFWGLNLIRVIEKRLNVLE